MLLTCECVEGSSAFPFYRSEKTIWESSLRASMGLPEGYTEHRCPRPEAIAELLTLDRAELARVCEDRATPFEKRHAAGELLARLGDPRITGAAPTMVSIPSGAYIIGTEQTTLPTIMQRLEGTGIQESWLAKECPPHEVEIPGLLIGKYPVTNVEYLSFLRENPTAEVPSSWTFGRYPAERSNHPVYSVGANAAESYCGWLSRKTGRHFRLPLEREWEIASAGRSGSEFPWGQSWLPDRANTLEELIFNTTPVGIFPRGTSWCGAVDLAGNVEELVQDDYRPYPGGVDIVDDLATRLGAYRIARGGSFSRFRDLARCQRRHGVINHALFAYGFRLAETT